PSGGVIALKSAPNVANQGPPGSLGVQVGVKLAHLAGPPEPLTGHKATVVSKYGQQSLLFLLTRGPVGAHTCSLEPGEQQAQVPAQPWEPLEFLHAFLHCTPERPAALEPHCIDSDLADGTSGHGVKH
uniref:Uncharacterized protein n=1 Tax=Poecilia formosa TaxID=48698 RepID=A0A087YPX2_POEFO